MKKEEEKIKHKKEDNDQKKDEGDNTELRPEEMDVRVRMYDKKRVGLMTWRRLK